MCVHVFSSCSFKLCVSHVEKIPSVHLVIKVLNLSYCSFFFPNFYLIRHPEKVVCREENRHDKKTFKFMKDVMIFESINFT